MTLRKLIPGLIAVATLAIPAQASAVRPLDAQQWVYPPRLQPSGGYAVTIYNTINGRTLGYQERRWGINLGWVGQKGNNEWVFQRQDGSKGKLAPGEKVALRNIEADDYVAYGKRAWGINLVWKNSPVYEWTVKWDPESGRFSLYNSAAGDYVVYGERPTGINLVWLGDLRKKLNAEAPGEKTASVMMRAQQVIQGYRPFLATYGGGIDGTLRKVTNAESDVVVSFVKPGYSTSDCGNPNAIVQLGPKATLTPDQMKAAFGSATPRLPATFLACAASPRQPDSFFLNIVYYKNS